jgi:radical SAM-linked protein
MNSEYRLRVAYTKQGRGAYLSHLEVIRALERMIRRSRLPYAVTQGFSPHMKVAFGPALGVGTASRCEHFDITLTGFVNPDEALRRLQDSATEVLRPAACGYVSAREPSLSAAVTVLQYQATVVPSIDIVTELPDVLEVEQKEKIKRYDTREVLPEGVSVTREDGRAVVSFTIRATPQGTLRPDALMRFLLGTKSPGDRARSQDNTKEQELDSAAGGAGTHPDGKEGGSGSADGVGAEDRKTRTTDNFADTARGDDFARQRSDIRITYERIATYIEDDEGTWHAPLR